MGFFNRDKNSHKRSDKRETGKATVADASKVVSSGVGPDGNATPRVGIVSGVLAPSGDTNEKTPFADVVARRFGPSLSDDAGHSELPPRHASPAENKDVKILADGSAKRDDSAAADPAARRDHLRAVEPLFSDSPATPVLEVDPMALIGRATTIIGDIVAEEDLEIQGTIEGSLRLANHQVTVGNDGHVKASVEANIIIVYGKITGDVVATDVVEVEKGGIVGGNIKAPRIIMHDGAIIVGALDMSASLPTSETKKATNRDSEKSVRPLLAPIATDTDDLLEDDGH